MFLKRFTFLALFATVFSSVQAQQLDATFDLLRFKASETQNMAELYVSVNGNSVVYKKVTGGYQASVALELQIADSAGVKYFDKLNLKSPLVKDTAGFKAPFNLQKRYFLKNGKYTFTGKAKDVNSAKAASAIDFPLNVNFDKTKVQISDVQLLESYEKSAEQNDYTKSGLKLVSYVSSFYPKGFDRLKFYTEIYNTEAVLGKDKPMVIFYRLVPDRDNKAKLTIGGQKLQKAAPVNVFMQDIDISSLESGNYQLFIEVRSEDNKTVATQTRYIQRSNPQADQPELAGNLKLEDLPAAFSTNLDTTKLNLYLNSLRPLSNAAEGNSIEGLTKSATLLQKENYLYAFWRKRSAADPEKAWADYKVRIDYVEKTFANKTFHGYESDLGRVYLQYGPPNKISNERNDINRPVQNTDVKPYLIWQYYQLASQSNRVFVFVQQNLGNSNYALVHSTANGEVTNNEWRRLIEQKFMRVDRNSRSDRTFDREGNETSTPDGTTIRKP
jgi:GWxTD domain-containing protein